jgi:hypothetical protein
MASPIVMWLDPWKWGFPTIFFLVSANVAVVVYLYFTILSYVFLLFRCGGWRLAVGPGGRWAGTGASRAVALAVSSRIWQLSAPTNQPPQPATNPPTNPLAASSSATSSCGP